MLDGPIPESFNAGYALDVLEHIAEADEDRFIENMVGSLDSDGVCVIGVPSLTSQQYASPQSLEGHVNCKSAPDLRALLSRFFRHVHIFSMNDEVVHTGFTPMASYYLALCEDVR
jgi:hypothetical protein